MPSAYWPSWIAIIIALVGCLYGMRTTGGTQGVGRSTTVSVVAGSVAVIAAELVTVGANVWPTVHVSGLARLTPSGVAEEPSPVMVAFPGTVMLFPLGPVAVYNSLKFELQY